MLNRHSESTCRDVVSYVSTCFIGLPSKQIHSKRPFNVVNGIQVNLHESADVIVAVFTEVVLIADPFVKWRVKLRQ